MATKYENYDCGDTEHVFRPFEGVLSERRRYAQTFTPSVSHSVTQVAMRLRQRGTAPTPYTVGIYATSGSLPTVDALASAEFVTTGITRDAGGEMKLVTLDSPANLVVGIEYAIKLVGPTGEGDSNNCLMWYFGGYGNGNPYADGQACTSVGDGAWVESSGDGGYDFGFEEWGDPWTPTTPAVTTQAVTSIAATTATGNGNITALGIPAATQHGHCWNITGTPTIADSKTENGVPSATGAFISSITGLTLGVTYYVRAYATNAVGTSYGDEVSFVARKYWYRLNIKDINLPYEDKDGSKELHVLLKNLSPTAKEAGGDGELVVEVKYEPAA